MRSTIIAMSLCLGAVAAGKGVEAAPPSKPTAAPIRVFGNWAVACDNGLRCEAVSLQPKELQYAGIGLVVTRDSGPTAQPSVTIGHILDGHHGDADIAVDNRIIVRGMLDKSETAAVPSAQVSPLIRALVTGKRLRLTGGGEVSHTSLDGASAAFRYMDAQQGRADTVRSSRRRPELQSQQPHVRAFGPRQAARAPRAMIRRLLQACYPTIRRWSW